MAVKPSTQGGAHDLVGVSSPAFLVRDGASFLELLAARAPEPVMGAPDPDAMLAFIGAHPESVSAGVAPDDDDEILQPRRATYGLSYAARTSP